MKKLTLAGLFLILGTLALYSQNLPSVRIVNNTGYDIFYIYMSPSNSDDWGNDILGDGILKNGDTFTWALPYPLSMHNVYDIGMEDEDEDTYIKWEVTITNNARIVFTQDDFDDG
jgi:hypothetical protein